MRLPTPSVRWSPGQRSTLSFAVVLAMAMLALAFPEMPAQLLLGILCTGAGVLFVLFPPVARLPLVWWLFGLGFLGLSLAGFMPRGWAGMPAWRQDLEALGLNTGPLAIVQVPLAAEALCGIAVAALLGLFLLGHRGDSRVQRGIALAFVVFCALWTVAALALHKPGGGDEAVFGFFPNRNHTATLLSMAVLVAWGCLMQAMGHKQKVGIAISALALALFLYAILSISESRAGVLLVAVGFLAWLPLAGLRYLRGNTGKAILLLILGLGGGLMVMDTPVKHRLMAALSKDGTTNIVAKDARLGIQQDALGMITAEPWCGVGPGQFVWIFPQYRKLTPVSGETPCLHPESDWLMVAAEHGWPAALCLAAGVALVFFMAFRAARQGRSRALRIACLVAAMLLGLHGFIDIPGHRSGLVLAAALLLAISLRPLEQGTTRGMAPPSRLGRIGWKVAGLPLGLLGLLLLGAQLGGRPVLPSVMASSERQRADELREKDRAAHETARETGIAYRPAKDEDPLRLARTSIERAAMIEPLDPSLQFVSGVIALYFNGGEDTARQAFAIQRLLAPQQSRMLLKQAGMWATRDPDHVKELWELALQHSAAEEQRVPGTQHAVKNIYENLFADAAANPDLAPLAFEFSGHDFARLEQWLRYSPPAAIDHFFPQLPADKLTPEERGVLLEMWRRRGSPPAVKNFSQQHPDFAPPQPASAENEKKNP